MMSPKDFKEKQIICAFINKGEKFSFKNDNIILTDSDGKIIHHSTCYLLFSLFIIGHVTITSGLIQRSKKFGFSIVFMTTSLRVYAMLSAGVEGNVLLRKKQYEYEGLEIASHLVDNKIHNQLSLLKKTRQKTDETKKAIELLEQHITDMVPDKSDLKRILGVEGSAARIYFNAVFFEYKWIARKPRVKHDMINCLMDIGYTLLFNLIDAMLDLYGFDKYHGVYHRQFYQRKSLVCDIVEPFRPLIDERILKALHLHQCHEKDFDIIQGQYRLYGKNSVPYISWLMEPLLERKDDIFLYVRDYYRAFMKDKPIKEYPVFRLME
jgi:CRISPR-associated protein Cas1